MGSAWEMDLQPIIGLDPEDSKDFPLLCNSWMKRCSAPAPPQSAFNHQQQQHPAESRLKDEHPPRGIPNNLQRQKQREPQCMSQLWSSSTTLENSNTSWEGDWSTSSGTPPIPKSDPSSPGPFLRHRTGPTTYPSGSDWSPGESSASNSVSSSYGMMQSSNASASPYYDNNGYNYNSGYNNYSAGGGYHQYQPRQGDVAAAAYNRNRPMSTVKQPVQEYYRRQGRYGVDGMAKVQIKTEPEDYTEAENFTSLFTTSLTSLYSGDNENTFSEDKTNYDPDIMICNPPPTSQPRIMEEQTGFQRMQPISAGSFSTNMGGGNYQDPRGSFGFFESRTPQNFQPPHPAGSNQDMGPDANRMNSFRYDRPSFDDMHLYATPHNDTKAQSNKKRKVSMPNITNENNFTENHRKKSPRATPFKSESQWTPNSFAFSDVQIKQEPKDDYNSNEMEMQKVSFKDTTQMSNSNGSKSLGQHQDHPKPPPRKRSPASTCFDRFDKKSTPSNKKISPLSVYAKIQESIVLSVKCRRYKKRTKPASNKEEVAPSLGKEEIENYKRTSLTPDQAARQVVDELLERVSLFGERSGIIPDLDHVGPNKVRELLMQFCRRYSLDYRDFEDVDHVLQPRIVKEKIAKNSARASAIRKRTSTSPVLSSDKAEQKKQVKKEDSTPTAKQRVLRSLPGRTDRGRSRRRRPSSSEKTPQRRYSTRSVKDVDDSRCSDDDIVIDSSTDRESEAGKEAEVRKKSQRIQNKTLLTTPAKARSTERKPAKGKVNKRDESRTRSKEKKAESPKSLPRNKRSRVRQANSRDSLRSSSIEVVDITRSNSPSPPLIDILKTELLPSLSKISEKVKRRKLKVEDESKEAASPKSPLLPATRRSRRKTAEVDDSSPPPKLVNLKRKQEDSCEVPKRSSKKPESICAPLKPKNSAKFRDSSENNEACLLDSLPKLQKKPFDNDASLNSSETPCKPSLEIKKDDESRTETPNPRRQLKEKGRKYLLDAPTLEPVLKTQLPIKIEDSVENSLKPDPSVQTCSFEAAITSSQLEDNDNRNKFPQTVNKNLSGGKMKHSQDGLSNFIIKIKEEKLDEQTSTISEKANIPVEIELKRPTRAVRTLPIKKLPRRRSSQLSDSELRVVLRKLPDSQINGSVNSPPDVKPNQVNVTPVPQDVTKLCESQPMDASDSFKISEAKPKATVQKILEKKTNENHSSLKKFPELVRIEKVSPVIDKVSITVEENSLPKAPKTSADALHDSTPAAGLCNASQPKFVKNHRRSESEDSDCGLVIDLDRRQSIEERVPSPTPQLNLSDAETPAKKKDPKGNSRQQSLVLNPFVHDAAEEAHILLQLSRGGLPPFPPDEYPEGSPEDSADNLCLPADIEDTIKQTDAEAKGPERDESILRTLLLETSAAESELQSQGEDSVDSKAHFNQDVLKFLMHEAYKAMPHSNGAVEDDKKIPFVNFLLGQLRDMNANLLSCAEELEDDPTALREEIIKLRNEIVYLQCMANQKDRERTAIVCFKRYKEEILRRLVKKYTMNVNAQEEDDSKTSKNDAKKSSSFDPIPSTSSASDDILHSPSTSNLQLIQMAYQNVIKTDTPTATITSGESLCAGENLPTVAAMVANATDNYGMDMRTVSRSSTSTTILQEALSSRESNYSPSTSGLSLSSPEQRLGESIQILQKALTSGRESNLSPSGPSRSPSLPELSPGAKPTHRSYSKLSSGSSPSPPNLQPETSTRSSFTSFKQHYPLALVASEAKLEVLKSPKPVISTIKSRDSTPLASPRSSPKHITGGNSYSAWNSVKSERKMSSTLSCSTTSIDLRTEHVKAQDKLKSSTKRSSSSSLAGHKFMVVPPPTTLQDSPKYGSHRSKSEAHGEKSLHNSMERIYRHDTEKDRPAATFSSVVSVSSSIAVVSSTLSSPPRCMGCGISDAKFICSGCRDHWYCSAQCQTLRWPEHSRVCVGSLYSSSPNSKYT